MSEPSPRFMGFEEYTSNPVFMTNLVCIVVFAIAFPSYFAIMADDDGSAGKGASSTPGNWIVSFNQTVEEFTEDVTLTEGESYSSQLDVNIPSGLVEANVAYISASISCNDNDDPGPGFTDRVTAQSDLSGVSGDFQEQSDDQGCNGNDVISMSWDVVANYSGESYEANDVSMDDIRQRWTDEGAGRGNWIIDITMDINSPPAIGGAIDNNEDVSITWTLVTFEVEIEPFNAMEEM